MIYIACAVLGGAFFWIGEMVLEIYHLHIGATVAAASAHAPDTPIATNC